MEHEVHARLERPHVVGRAERGVDQGQYTVAATDLGESIAIGRDLGVSELRLDVRELFLLPYAEAWRTGRLRGSAADVLGPVLSRNASVALDAILAPHDLTPEGRVDTPF